MTDLQKGTEPAAAPPGIAAIAPEPEPVVPDRRSAGLTALPPPSASLSATRPAELVAEAAGAANETGDRLLGKILGRIPEAETNIRKHIDERLAELPAAIERRLTAPPRRNAPPEAVPNLLERISAQSAETETNLAKFIEMRTGRLETAADKFAANSPEAGAAPEAAAAPEDAGQTVVQASEAATADVVPPVADVEPAGQVGSPASVAAAAAKLEKQVRTRAADFQRWQSVNRTRSRRLAAAVAAVGAPCLLALGLLLHAQFAILPAPDPTNGWRDLVWNRYGAEIADCVLRARAAGKRSACEIVVP